ncbi:AMP-binding protein [Ectobacillus antri]|jgi:long-chain acyl-CoA synthetase|uniref:Acyl-CoA synthetase n=1 Tax=Ectobacillus antri TaxID=2486280 RepID=A0ABT6H501_9BACI|nr:AMP-binding protein [Ectobacillus antri]MDG4657486.1 AMP-binding protein [Ectobacillus antri]MDG5753799.1 AMP-binding protein [Ectobacillus antri]
MLTLTVPQLLWERAQTTPNKTALRYKDLGIWNEVTWHEYYEQVKHFALGLQELGFKRGHKLAIIGENRRQWIIAEIAAQSLGGISVGIYQESLSHEIAYILKDCGATFAVVEDQEQIDKLLEIEHNIPVQHMIYYDNRGMRRYTHQKVKDFTAVQDIGKTKQSSLFESEMQKGKYKDIAIFSYTSGTTGNPKGTMLTYENLLEMAKHLSDVDPLCDTDEYVSFLPLAWIGEQMMSVAMAMYNGITINFPEEPSTVLQNIREIGPHVMFSPPRVYEDMVSRFLVRMQDAGWFKRKLYQWFKPIGEAHAEAALSNKPLSFTNKLLYTLSDYFLFSAIRDHLGLLRIKRAYTGGAALGPDVTKFFHSIGVNLKQIYGQTEISGIALVHRDGDIKFDSVGVPIPGTEVKISEEGEIMLKSPSVCVGYYQNETSTKDTIQDGWLHTGDAGYVDEDGHVYVIDRLKDVIRLQSGEMFSPQFIENKLKFSPYIKEAVAIGKDRPYVVGMINIDMENVGRWAEKNQIVYTTYIDLAGKKEVLELIQKEIQQVNEALPEKARVQKFVLLYKELDADDEELTRTKKVRRGFVLQKYQPLVDGLYSDENSIQVVGTVKYRDGNEATIETTLQVMTLGEEVA